MAATCSPLVDQLSGRVLPCIALQDPAGAAEDPLAGFMDRISGRIFPCVALIAVEVDAANRVRADPLPPSSSGRLAISQPARTGPSNSSSWAVVAAHGRPTLRSIIVAPAVAIHSALAVDAGQARVPAARLYGDPRATEAADRAITQEEEGGLEWEVAASRRARCLARRQAARFPQWTKDPVHR